MQASVLDTAKQVCDKPGPKSSRCLQLSKSYLFTEWEKKKKVPALVNSQCSAKTHTSVQLFRMFHGTTFNETQNHGNIQVF